MVFCALSPYFLQVLGEIFQCGSFLIATSNILFLRADYVEVFWLLDDFILEILDDVSVYLRLRCNGEKHRVWVVVATTASLLDPDYDLLDFSATRIELFLCLQPGDFRIKLTVNHTKCLVYSWLDSLTIARPLSGFPFVFLHYLHQ